MSVRDRRRPLFEGDDEKKDSRDSVGETAEVGTSTLAGFSMAEKSRAEGVGNGDE